MTIMIPTLVALAGALLYLAPIKHDGIRQLALYAYACGLLVTLFALSGHTIRIG